MGVTIGAMLEEIQGLYKQHHQPCFLYLSSEVIKIFGSDPSCADYLKVLIKSLFSTTACLLTKFQDFTSRPDIADDCFLLASRCIRYCPHLLFPSPVFPSLVECAMIGITVQHREASNSILSFLSEGHCHCPTRFQHHTNPSRRFNRGPPKFTTRNRCIRVVSPLKGVQVKSIGMGQRECVPDSGLCSNRHGKVKILLILLAEN